MKHLMAAAIIVPAALLIMINAIGGIMWDLADNMPLWWEDRDE